MLGLDRITFNPRIMAGQACIRGMRVPVSLILNLVANGKTVEEIIEDYPYSGSRCNEVHLNQLSRLDRFLPRHFYCTS
ncbi:MAG: DUF433 domain-containing protein [Symploca sp. SIO3E6]|nr:DUF433 domain-containing protein [Caldora sp. SIO3E6]